MQSKARKILLSMFIFSYQTNQFVSPFAGTYKVHTMKKNGRTFLHKLICSIWFYVCWFITQSVVFNWMHVWVFNQWYGQVQGCQGVSWICSLMRENSIPILLIHSLFFPSRTNIDFPFRILVVFTFSWFYHLFSFSQPARFSQRRLNSKQWHKLKWWTSNNVRLLFVEMFNEIVQNKNIDGNL